ncbi:hypothetical protein, unlikely [Trypanosoma brucei brucei TREU927]|uniref:Uncharacterized protein n=1 Tax=Trypanosoma brucei brucei (strain 927/4 GUTat10.1) TaxID=185431 RepID=Q38E43_TRYB2|nr:hypothetical protein, unlikely [Trypanosoma brucei brucei TREU927]EAN76927.1 hypothetical protein, unlikely [Trypanosoma brucei brucei TREU927]
MDAICVCLFVCFSFRWLRGKCSVCVCVCVSLI